MRRTYGEKDHRTFQKQTEYTIADSVPSIQILSQ